MAKTLLNAVNAILKRTQIIAGDSGALTSLTDSARQHYIDVAVQVVNEGNDELYTAAEMPQPNGQGSSTITLVAGTRAYALASDLVRLRWPMIDRTNSQFLYEYAGGYNALLELDPEQDDTGLPFAAAIRPTDGYLHMNCAPTASDAGRIYTYQYDKSLEMTLLTDTVPYNNQIFNAMVPVWTQLWKRDARSEFDQALFTENRGRAARLLSKRVPATSYSPR